MAENKSRKPEGRIWDLIETLLNGQTTIDHLPPQELQGLTKTRHNAGTPDEWELARLHYKSVAADELDDHDRNASATGMQTIQMPRHFDAVATGNKFKSGRKVGAESDLKKAVRKKLEKDASLKPRALWLSFYEKPLRGMKVSRLPVNEGSFIEYKGAETCYKRFQNIVCEVKRDLRKKISY